MSESSRSGHHPPTRQFYLEDVARRNFTAEVFAAGERAGKPQVLLAATCFYPEGGGQPADHGAIGEAQVIDVVMGDGGQIWHVLDRPLPLGAFPAVVDSDRRRDHTQQHSGQHLLSQCLVRIAGAATVAFHLGADEVTIDVEHADLAQDAAQAAEALANRIVLENRPVTIETLTPDAAAAAGIAVPAGLEGPLRVVSIADFDRTACGGTHVERTGEIGPVKIRKLERTRGRTRVAFHCGDRSLADYVWRHDALRGLGAILSAGERAVPELVARVIEERRVLAEQVSALEVALARERAPALAAQSTEVAGFRVVRVAAESWSMARALAQALASGERVVALAGTETGAETRLVFAASPAVPLDLGRIVKDVAAGIGGRGGGRAQWAEAGGGRVGGLEQALLDAADRVREALRSAPS